MGATPRNHRFQLPMATRSTDVSMMAQCPGRWVLTNLYEKEQAEASFFLLGSQLHETIETSIVMDLDLDQALTHAGAGLDRELERIEATTNRRIESSKRGFDTMHDDAARMLRNWFRSVHPDSPKRHPWYEDYYWPPATEVKFIRAIPEAKHPIWGSVDALFALKGSIRDEPIYGVADWKSGSSRQRDSNQLHFYEYGLDLRHVSAWFHHLDKVRNSAIIQMADPYPGDDAVRQRILATEAIKDSIAAGEYPRFIPDWYCNYCPVQHVCPADGDVRNRDQNMLHLTKMLKLVRPMTTIEKVA